MTTWQVRACCPADTLLTVCIGVLPPPLPHRCCLPAGEMCRFGASHLHCLGAIVGGIAAQEAIKLVTHQFVPLAGTLIYNAMSSTSAIFRF